MTRSHRDDGDDEQDPDDRRPGTRIDIGLSVTDLLSDLLDGQRTDANRRSGRERPSGRPTRGRPSSPGGDRDAAEPSDDDYHVSSRRTDDCLTVVADLPGADRREVTAGIDPSRNRLVVAVGDRFAGRVSLPWDPVEVTDASFNNGVLEVRVRPAGGPSA